MPTLPDNPLSAEQHRKLESFYARLANNPGKYTGMTFNVPMIRVIRKELDELALKHRRMAQDLERMEN